MFGLSPKSLEFFDCVERSEENRLECAELLAGFPKTREVKDFGQVGPNPESDHSSDEIARETLDRLEQAFITPVDRDDIHRLINRIDNILDTPGVVAPRRIYYLQLQDASRFVARN